ncbi:MAG: serine/threonine-protein kinase [Myxococcales bacterium]
MSYGLPAPGDVIAGKYTVERQLGQGGMGAVFAVTHSITSKRLALKCLLPEHATNADIVERFLREAQAAGRIQHRHVVDVFDVGREGGLLYIVMEFLEGKALSDLLHDTSLTLKDALTIIVRAMEGVAAAHAQGIIHRDLKPDNIFVCVGPSGQLDDPRVLDFGISKLDNKVNGNLTKTGATMGTPYYMSLEQMSGARDLDARVDVYAMGVILYEAISGEPPHVAESLSALAIRVLTTEPVHLGKLRPDLPAGLADVVMKAIAKERDKRYPDLRSLIDAVMPFVAQGASSRTITGSGSQPLRTPRTNNIASDLTVPQTATPAALSAAPAAPVAEKPAQEEWVGSRSSAGTAPEPLRTSPPKSPLMLGAAVGALVLALGAAGVWLSRRDKPVAEVPQPPKVTEPAALAPPASPLPSTIERPAAQPPQQQATQLTPEPTPAAPQDNTAPADEPTGKPGRKHRDKSDKHGQAPQAGATAPSQSAPAVATPVAPTPTPTPAKEKTGVVKGRAGEIAPDDF